jgi:choline dehydrogenase-like flavoprotein
MAAAGVCCKVLDGSTVPGPPGVNPQLTIMAMATRAAEKIAERT